MNKTWLIYTGLTVIYIIVLVIYFLRRSKSHEAELTKFLSTAKEQVELHKQEASKQAQEKVVKAMAVVKKVQEAAALFEDNAQEEYDAILEDAKDKKRDMLSSAKAEIEELFKQAEVELDEYKAHRQQEIEKNLVKMVVAITEKVVGTGFSVDQHKDLIYKSLEEIKTKKTRAG